ncbi:MAG: helix-turn-helix domain-containing protein [Solobacterium sp.]|nr:helix-turn-helix domain-containing protein [Solobacterium sp.]
MKTGSVEEMKDLTPTERNILEFLQDHAGETCSPEEIYTAVWQAEPYDCRGIIAVHLCHLREKIKALPGAPAIRSYWGRGYCCVTE